MDVIAYFSDTSFADALTACYMNTGYKVGIFLSSFSNCEDVFYSLMHFAGGNLPGVLRTTPFKGGSFEVEFYNGSIITVSTANDRSKGMRFNAILVENTVTTDTINKVLTPMLYPYRTIHDVDTFWWRPKLHNEQECEEETNDADGSLDEFLRSFKIVNKTCCAATNLCE